MIWDSYNAPCWMSSNSIDKMFKVTEWNRWQSETTLQIRVKTLTWEIVAIVLCSAYVCPNVFVKCLFTVGFSKFKVCRFPPFPNIMSKTLKKILFTECRTPWHGMLTQKNMISIVKIWHWPCIQTLSKIFPIFSNQIQSRVLNPIW